MVSRKNQHQEQQTEGSTEPVPIGEILNEVFDTSSHKVNLDPAKEKARKLEVAERLKDIIQTSRATEIERQQSGVGYSSEFIADTGQALIEATAAVEELKQQAREEES